MAQGGTQTARKPREQAAAELARELIVFADGLEAAAGIAPEATLAYDQDGRVVYARKLRALARETVWLADQLAAERSARRAIQTDRDRCLQILAAHAGAAAKPLRLLR